MPYLDALDRIPADEAAKMILGVLRCTGRELANQASVMSVAFAGTPDAFNKLHSSLLNMGVELSAKEKQAVEEKAVQDFAENLLRSVPMKAKENG